LFAILGTTSRSLNKTTTRSTVLRAGGAERTAVEMDEAQEMMQNFIRELCHANTSCHTLDLSGRVWRIEMLEVWEPVLQRVAITVHTLKLNNIIASLETSHAWATLE
jgi:hypothetical protein